jgi:hypothetical protein
MQRNYTGTETSVNSRSKHPGPANRRLEAIRAHLRKWTGRGEQSVQHHFLQGAAYKLGSGAVTLLILWWEARR